jgi:hypothetical protein
MQVALPHPSVQTQRVVVPLVALVLGAGAAVGLYAALDNPNTVAAPAPVSETHVVTIPSNNYPTYWPNERPLASSGAATANGSISTGPNTMGARP